MDRSWEDAFGVLSCQALSEYSFAMWYLDRDSHLILRDRIVSGESFLTDSVFECNIAHRRSVEYYVRCIRSGVTRCTHFMVLYMCHM